MDESALIILVPRDEVTPCGPSSEIRPGYRSAVVSAGGSIKPAGNFPLEWPPTVAIDGAGNVAIDSSRAQGLNWTAIDVARPAGGPWQPPADLSRPAENAVSPRVAFDAAGNETAVWLSDDRPNSVIMAATRPAGGAWEEPVAVSGPGAEFLYRSLTVTPGGEATAVWTKRMGSEEFVVQSASRPPGGAWGTPVELSGVGTASEILGNYGHSTVASDAAGDLTAAWEIDVAGETTIPRYTIHFSGPHAFRVKAVSPTAGASPVRTVKLIAGRSAPA